VKLDRVVHVKIPKWCPDGYQIVLGGLGVQKVKPTDISGDLIIRVRVKPDPNFERDGNSLVYRPTISFVESLIGMPLVIPHFDGSFVYDTRQLGVIDPTRIYEIPEKSIKLSFKINYPTREPWSSQESKLIRECFELKIKNV
jgi:molecular chaperone DnaJ